MSSPNINQVRQHLLDTLADLRDRSNPMDTDRARAIATVASVLVDTAKVEVDFIKATSNDGTAFMESTEQAGRISTTSGIPSAHNPFPNRTTHKLAG